MPSRAPGREQKLRSSPRPFTVALELGTGHFPESPRGAKRGTCIAEAAVPPPGKTPKPRLSDTIKKAPSENGATDNIVGVKGGIGVNVRKRRWKTNDESASLAMRLLREPRQGVVRRLPEAELWGGSGI